MPETYAELLERQDRELPRLPVPPLQETMKRYLLSTKPFLTDDEYKTTEKTVMEFFSSDLAAKLQKLLQDRAAKSKNWMADWWLNVAYLDNRTPLPVYSSTAATFPPVNLTPDFDYLQLATALIAGNLEFKIKLMDENVLPPWKLGKNEMCMHQTQHFYSTCRLPGEKRDQLRVNIPCSAKHITVVRRNNIFMVPVYDLSGKVLNQSQILSQLKLVVGQSENASTAPVGVLTTEERVVWWKARESLLKASDENRKNFDWIETALFTICLDKPLSKKELQKGDRLLGITERSMHGGSVDVSEAGNRWVDMICQFVITESGEVGFPTEHSPVEANPILSNYLYEFWTSRRGKDNVAPAGRFDPPKKLIFKVPDDVQAMLPTAFANIRQLASLLEVHHFDYAGYGRNFIRQMKIGSADSLIQLAIQLTFYKLHHVPGAQYETASTRSFLRGRTETIRSCSVDSINFARTMLSATASDIEKARALKKAMNSHRNYVMNAMMGNGVDRHLFGLRMIAAENGIEVPKMYQDPGYLRSTNMRLSTSQVASVFNLAATFSPLTQDGYGCCYNPMAEEILFCVTTFTSCSETSAVKFSQAMKESLNDLKNIALRVVTFDKL